MVLEEINARLEALAENSIARALAISLICHLVLFSTIEVAYRLGWTRHSLLNSFLLANRNKADLQRRREAKPSATQQDQRVPLVFVEVDPAVATEEAPKEAQYYSSQNSRAANPDTRVNSETPRIAGTQDKVPKTTDTPRTVPTPAPPAPPAEPKTETDRPKSEPQPLQPQLAQPIPESGPKPGDTEVAKPSDLPKFSTDITPTQVAAASPPARIRPRRLPPALTQDSSLAGQKMKQEGGVRRFSIAEGLDVKATPFGSYDAMIIARIQKRWFDLLDERDFARGHVGKVVLTFHLNANGTITQMQVMENEVTDILALLCQRAVQDPAPYPPWPNDMRRYIGADYREVKFTFHHN